MLSGLESIAPATAILFSCHLDALMIMSSYSVVFLNYLYFTAQLARVAWLDVTCNTGKSHILRDINRSRLLLISSRIHITILYLQRDIRLFLICVKELTGFVFDAVQLEDKWVASLTNQGGSPLCCCRFDGSR